MYICLYRYCTQPMLDKKRGKKLEMLGFEPRTFCLQSRRSTAELHPHLGKGCNCGSYQCNFPNTVIRTRWSEWSGILTQNDCVGQLCIDTSYNCIPTARWGCSSAVERLLCMQKVLGSKPSISNFFFPILFAQPSLFIIQRSLSYYHHLFADVCSWPAVFV